jgi:hypothetical protein
VGGFGLFVYIVLWLILPEARSLTDKMQMQGEPVTLSNIESTIKKNQSEASEDESTITKILLFPFRLIGMILTGVGRILGPILEIIRVGIGVIMVLVGISFVFSIVVTGGVLFGIFSAATFSLPWINELNETTVPVDAIVRAFPGWTAFAAFIGTVVPSIFIILLGVSVIAKRIVFTAAAGWTLFALFFISVAMLSVGIPKIIFSFKEDGEYRVENVYKVNGKTAILKINEVGMDDYDQTKLSLRGHEGSDFRLVQDFEAQGPTRAKAIENARMVDYYVDFKDSVFTFDSNLRFKPDAIFRAQRLNMILYVPYNFPFRMDEGVNRIVTQYVDCCGMAGTNNIDQFTWKITEADGLTCIDCPNVDDGDDDSHDGDNENWGSSSLSDFDEVEISGKFDVRISNRGNYGVELIGAEGEKEKYKIYRSGKTLIIEYTHQGRKNRMDINDWSNLNAEDMRINISMPSLQKLEATGIGTVRFDDFTSDEMEIETTGPVRLRGELNAHDLTVNLTGKSEADLSGNVNKLNARIEFASKLRAYNLEVADAFIEVSGASSAKVNVSGNLEIEEGVASHVDYRGNPNIVRHD